MPVSASLLAPAAEAEATATVVDNIYEHAASCGQLDCGHLGRGSSRAVRRAVILYVADGAGYPGLREILEGEDTGVQAVYGALQNARHARPTYVRGTLASGARGYVPASPNMRPLPNAAGIKMTHQRLAVFHAMGQGYSATQIAENQHRSIHTVKSHAGYLRTLTGAHDSTSALVALALADMIDLA